MALQKEIQTSFGIPATYWRILRINELFKDTAEVFLAGYADKDARDNNAEPLEVRTIIIPSEDQTRTQIYELLTTSKTEMRATGEVDEDGEPIMEEVETNVFVNAPEW